MRNGTSIDKEPSFRSRVAARTTAAKMDRNGIEDYEFHASDDQKLKSWLSDLDEFWRMHRKSLEDPDSFWRSAASPFFWKDPLPESVLNYNFDVRNGKIYVECMKGATTNICYNALDRNIRLGHGDQIAFYWEGNDPQDSDQITYKELLNRVCRFANVLKAKGIQKGDMVAIYMPMILELAIAMFACARIGAIHSVVFGGYSAESLAERILDGKCKILVTADGVWRGEKYVHLKDIADKTIKICREKGHKITSNIVVAHQKRLPSAKRQLSLNGMNHLKEYNLEVSWNTEIDCWWNEEMQNVTDTCEPVWVDSEDTLFTLYTSGSTGKPKGCVHTTGAYMVYGALSFKYIFDYFPGDVFFCTGDIGWLTGHTYIVYGSLLNAATCIIYEGVPTHPHPGRYWEIVEKYGVTHFYTAPTAIRTLMRFDNKFVTKYNRSSLKVLASVGEPINREAWHWYQGIVGNGTCPIVDTFWQTETGGIVITPIPFCTPLKPGCASLPFFGVQPVILDEKGNEIKGPGKGYLCVKKPWPAIMRTVFGDHDRYENTYFRRFPGYYFTGDGARRDENGFFWITGRVDDMLNVSGHLLSTSEVEAALVEHNNIAEAAVVPYPHTIKGECLYCFIVLKDGFEFTGRLVQELKQKVVSRIGPIATPDYFHHATALPKTRSGKTVRRILKKIATGDRNLGDSSTLIDESVIEELFASPKYNVRLSIDTNNIPLIK